MMKFGPTLGCLLALGACNTPPLGYAGIDPVQVTVDQSTFDVRVKDGRAQAMRINREFAPNLSYVAPRARAAIEQATGCQVAEGSMVGDSILITADLECGPTSQDMTK